MDAEENAYGSGRFRVDKDRTLQGRSARATDADRFYSRESAATSLIKELIRIFTRKVPGGLVPDELVRGFIQAYRDLEGPQQRLAFHRLVVSEMGLSVGDVDAAVRIWSSLPTRGSFAMAAAPESPPAAVAAAAAPSGPAAGYQGAPMPSENFHEAAYRAADRLASASRPLYTQLFLPISQAPEGMKFLVDLRADLLDGAARLASSPAESAPLRAMAEHLRQSLADWFSVGLLQLRPISWQESPAALLERVMRAEAVHPLASWEDLRARLGPRRRVFAFIHPSMPGEPLVVLHTALLDEPAAAMSDILEQPLGPGFPPTPARRHTPTCPSKDPPSAASSHSTTIPDDVQRSTGDTATASAGELPQQRLHGAPHASSLAEPRAQARLGTDVHRQQWEPRTAVFYSISSSQPGLRGIELGHFLIKRVAEQLMTEHPSIRQLVTLSPLPNFRSWLISRLRQEQAATMSSSQLTLQHSQPQRQCQYQTQDQSHQEKQAHVQPPPGQVQGRHTQAQSPPGSADDGTGHVETLRPGAELGGRASGSTSLIHPGEALPIVRVALSLGWRGSRRGGGACAGTESPTCGLDGVDGSAADGTGCGTGSMPLGSAEETASATSVAASALLWLLEGDRWLSGYGTQPGAADRALTQAKTAVPGSTGLQAETVLRPLLLRLAARYVAVEKRRRFALCPVAHFHLRNGASVWRLNWRADMSSLGVQRSFGIMVNYDYSLREVYDNNRKYLLLHEVQTHPRVLQLLQKVDIPSGFGV